MQIIKGIMPVLPTPFTDDGEQIDSACFQKIVRMAIRDGAQALCLFAAGAEFYKLSLDERYKLFDAGVEANEGKLPLIATVSSHSTVLAIEEAAHYEKEGASALNIMPPSFAGPTQGMIADHISRIASSVEVPLIIQYAPALTGQSISAETFSRLCGSGRELYIKLEASPTGPAITALRKATDDQYGIIVGNGGECMFEALERGACAVMPGAATIRIFRMIYDAYTAGNTEEAFALFNQFLPHIHFMLRDIESFVMLEKTILQRRGIMRNAVCRRPCREVDGYTMQLLQRHLDYLERVLVKD